MLHFLIKWAQWGNISGKTKANALLNIQWRQVAERDCFKFAGENNYKFGENHKKSATFLHSNCFTKILSSKSTFLRANLEVLHDALLVWLCLEALAELQLADPRSNWKAGSPAKGR